MDGVVVCQNLIGRRLAEAFNRYQTGHGFIAIPSSRLWNEFVG